MQLGQPLYLVSACGSAEEFVAAFRRYADRTGLFVPSSAPLPAGRRGRIAITLKDGGVMIEGEAEILQSSAKPTILHGRPGMTLKFLDPDDASKAVIGELEKARLALRPSPPNVTPRPAEVPAEPRPVPPALGGRIDAANALAECVVIGDASTLTATASAPGAPKFVVPAVPSIPPTARPKTPSGPIPKPVEHGNKSGGAKLTSIGIPIVDKLPAVPATAAPPSPELQQDPLAATQIGLKPAPPAASKFVPAATALGVGREKEPTRPPPVGKLAPLTVHDETTTIGEVMPPRKPAEMPPRKPSLHDEKTTIGEGPPRKPTGQMAPLEKPAEPPRKPTDQIVPLAKAEPAPQKRTDPMPTTAPAQTGDMAAVPEPVSAVAEKSSPRAHDSGVFRGRLDPKHKATSIGFPVVRTPFETQPVGLIPPAAIGDPSAPIVAKAPPKQQPPRGKPPTAPPYAPRHPTPVVPVPIVKIPAKNAPLITTEDEATEINEIPVPPSEAPAAHSATQEVPVPQVDPIEQIAARSGGMRASEIMAAIPTEDWTMTPDASAPTVLPTEPKDGEPDKASGEEPSMPSGPPTGDWSIQLDPEQGWSAPSKVEKLAPIPAAVPATGNPVGAIASEKALTVQSWDDKPTSMGEAKIEVDATLMEPLAPLPGVDDASPGSSGSALAHNATEPMPDYQQQAQALGRAATQLESNTAPHGVPRMEAIPPPLAPMPPMAPTAGFAPMSSAFIAPADAARGSMVGFGAVNPGAVARAKRTRTIVIAAVAAALVVGAIVVVIVLLAGGNNKTASSVKPSGSGSAQIGSAAPQTGTAAGSAAPVAVGSAAVAVGSAAPAGETVGSAAGSASGGSADLGAGAGSAIAATGSAAEPATTDAAAAAQPPTGGTCNVQLASVPNGAEILFDKRKLGVTPAKIELPCGVESRLTLKKAKFSATARAVTPVAGKPNNVTVKLGKIVFSIRVTSTPAGATIVVAGKSMGVTPTTIKLPGFEPATITLSKPGFERNSGKMTPKANGASHHVALKKAPRR